MLRKLMVSTLILGLWACQQSYNPLADYELKEPSTLHDVPVFQSNYPAEQVQRGKYIAELLGCGTCHTDGALVGSPDMKRQFAGSSIGIAYSNPFVIKNPGVVYPANITPDIATGIGSWTDDNLVRLLRTGVDAHGRQQLPVMPWPGYAKMVEEDARSIVAFLRSLKPVNNMVPMNVDPGQKAVSPFVHFGVYQSRQSIR